MLASEQESIARILLLTILFCQSIILLSNASEILPKSLEEKQNAPGIAQVAKYQVPFLILMSKNEICVAQLPLIDNGSISVIYQLSGSSKTDRDREDLHGDVVRNNSESTLKPSSSSFSSFFSSFSPVSATSTKSSTNADALEYEQMPKSASLGKSEWQQIASSKLPAAAAAAASNHKEEVGMKRRGQEDVGEEEGKKKEINRPRRSNNLTGDDASVGSGNSSSASSASSNNGMSQPQSNNDPRNSNAVLESAQTLNVTSAHSGTEEEAASASSSLLSEEAEEDGNDTSDAGDSNSYDEFGSEKERSNSMVQFCDFDVHMALGYAFVADSSGRIHRFRLSGFEKGNSNEYLMENDYTNTIDAASILRANDFSQHQSSTSLLNHLVLATTNKQHSSSRNGSASIDNNDIVDDSGYSNDVAASTVADVDDDSNKLASGSSAVTHEQSGRHPTVSALTQTVQPASVFIKGESPGDTPTSAEPSISIVSKFTIKIRTHRGERERQKEREKDVAYRIMQQESKH